MFDMSSEYQQVRDEVYRIDRQVYKLSREGTWKGPNHDWEVTQSFKMKKGTLKKWKCRHCEANTMMYHKSDGITASASLSESGHNSFSYSWSVGNILRTRSSSFRVLRSKSGVWVKSRSSREVGLTDLEFMIWKTLNE